MANSVYDPEQEQESGQVPPNDLGADQNQPMGDGSDPRGAPTSYNAPASSPYDGENPYNSQTSPGSVSYNPYGSAKQDNPWDQQRNNLANSEKNPNVNQTGDGAGGEKSPEALRNSESSPQSMYNAGGDEPEPQPKKKRSRFGIGGGLGALSPIGGKGNFVKNKGLLALYASVVGGVISIFIAIIMFIPLKIHGMLESINDRFSISTSMITEMGAHIFKDYMVDKVLPEYKNCGTTIDRNCKVIIGKSNNPIRELQRSWADTRIENKLAERGIEFRYSSTSDRWYMKTPGLGEPGVELGRSGEKFFQFGGGSPVEREAMALLNSEIRNETLHKRIFLRYQFGGLMENKYNVTRCVLACNVKRTVKDTKDIAQLLMVERVVKQFNSTKGLILLCLMADCAPDRTTPTTNAEAPGQNGAPQGELEQRTREALQTLAAQTSVTGDLDAAAKEYREIVDQGLQKYFITKTLGPLLGQGTAAATADLIPIIGWINLAAQIIHTADQVGPAVEKMRYVLIAAAAVRTYMLYTSYNDEMHAGKVEAGELGSMVDSLGPGDKSEGQEKQIGGFAGAEDSPLYASLIAGQPIDNKKSGVVCRDGDPPPSGQLVCDEEKLTGGHAITNAVDDFVGQPQFAGVVLIANVLTGTIGKVFEFAGDTAGAAGGFVLKSAFAAYDGLVCSLPGPAWAQPGNILPPIFGYCVAKEKVPEAATKILDAFSDAVLISPIGAIMGGGRIVDMIIAGKDVADSDATRTLLGGEPIDQAKANQINAEAEKMAQLEFKQQPFMARMFSTETNRSLVSRMAMATPLNMQVAVQTNATNLLANPLGMFARTFSSLIPKASADTFALKEDPFGIQQYGYEKMPTDPEKYWEENCSDNPDQAYQSDAAYAIYNWNQDAADNPDSTGRPQNNKNNPNPGTKDSTNPCLLIKTTSGAMGGKYNKSLLTQDQQKYITPKGSKYE